MVGPGQGRAGVGRERPRRVLHVRAGRGRQVPQPTRPRPHLPGSPGGGGRVRVLREAAAGDAVLGAELLRRVRQRGRHDVRRRDAHVLLPDIKTVREEGEIPIQRHQQRPAGHAAARAAQEEITDAACPVQRTVR